MFVNIEEGAPSILRFFGNGSVHLPAERPDLVALFPSELVEDHGFRSIIEIDVHRVSTSCGYAVPEYAYLRERHVLKDYTAKKGKEGMVEYRILKNSFSIDGLDSLTRYDPNAPTVKAVPTDGYYFGHRANAIERIGIGCYKLASIACDRLLSVNTLLGAAVGYVVAVKLAGH